MNGDALQWAANELIEDPTFATEAKSNRYLLKLTMLSGRSTVVAAEDDDYVELVLDKARERLGLPDDGATMEVWHGSESVPDDEVVQDWPGIQ
eukprot:5610415-Amphidinium_carterae.1